MKELVVGFRGSPGSQVGYNFFGGCSDPHATAFFEAAGITDEVEMEAVCIFVKALKAAGLWDKAKVIYIISPTSLSAASYNLKDPSSFQITWNGTTAGVHAAEGITGNGTDFYGDPAFVPTSNGLSATNICIYYRVNNDINSVAHDLGTHLNKGAKMAMSSRRSNNFETFNQVPAAGVQFANANSIGSYTYSEADGGGVEYYYKDGALLGTTTNASLTYLTVTPFFWGSNRAGTAVTFSPHRIPFIGYFQFLTTDEIALLNTIESTLQSNIIEAGRL